MTAAASRASNAEPFTIYVNRDADGITFALDPLSHKYLRSQLHADVRMWPLVFIGRETQEDFEDLGASLQNQVVTLLTGLSAERARAFGNFVFTTPEEAVLASWPPDRP